MEAVRDAALVEEARRGEAAALGALLERHRARLYAVALSILGRRAEAQDAVQDAMLIGLRRLDELRNPTAAGAWLVAITRNVCRMRLRSAREQPVESVGLGGVDGFDMEQAIERLALRDWVWTALHQIPADLRATVLLRFFSRHGSYAEIATVLGVPVGTVRSRLNKSKQRLATALLETAASVHPDHSLLTRERLSRWREAVKEIESDGTADIYSAECLPDVLVEQPSINYQAIGIEDHRRGVEESAAAGVRLTVTNVIAAEDITIMDGFYENPEHDPEHCPPTHTEVRIHPGGLTKRLILHHDGW